MVRNIITIVTQLYDSLATWNGLLAARAARPPLRCGPVSRRARHRPTCPKAVKLSNRACLRRRFEFWANRDGKRAALNARLARRLPGTDCCGACGPLTSLALGAPFAALWRPPSPLRGAVVEPACLCRRFEFWMIGGAYRRASVAPPAIGSPGRIQNAKIHRVL